MYFKVGDKVKYIEHVFSKDENFFSIGESYTISEVIDETRYRVRSKQSPFPFVYGHQLELIERVSEDIDHDTLENKPDQDESTRNYNVGSSDYAKHKIQPWVIWYEYGLNPWDADIIKRVLRTKDGDPRELDYEKIIHICKERIRQIESEKK